jgi:predicted aspartyl protease
MRGYLQRWLIQHNMTAEDFRKQAGLCASARDLACEEASWRDYTRLRPNDAAGRLSLAMTLNRRNRNDEAVVEFRKALDRGEGSYELFAWYADSLARLGRTGEAIEWSYKALAALPSLVDVRGKLAGLLVGANRPYEALALLESYDAELEARGHSTYFMGQRGAIEAAIDGSGPDNTGEPAALRLPAYGGHYFAPVTLGKTRTATFMVDGGMEPMSISEAELAASRVGFRVTGRALRALSADGHEVPARAITIDRIRVGRFDLDNVQAVACASCPLVLGQSVLSQFDVQSTRVQGVEFLSFVKRGAREVASPATSPVASPRG